MGLALAFSLGYGLFCAALLRVFTNQPDVMAATSPYFFWTNRFWHTFLESTCSRSPLISTRMDSS